MQLIRPTPTTIRPPVSDAAAPAEAAAMREKFYKTRYCMNFAQGQCTYGLRCTFAHGEHELRRRLPGQMPMAGMGLSTFAAAGNMADSSQAELPTTGGGGSGWDTTA